MNPSAHKSGGDGDQRPRRMADDHDTRLSYAQKGRVLRGAIKSLDLRVADIANEINVSQGHLSKVLDTYCDLDINTCEMYLKKVQGVLAKHGVRISESDDQIIVMFERSGFVLEFKTPND